MKLFSTKWMIIVYRVMMACQVISQRRSFHDIVVAAYDSSAHNKHRAALTLLHQANALRGIDTGYHESVNLYLGSNYEAIGKIDSALLSFGKAITYFESKNDSANLSYLYNRLGLIELNFTKQYNKAIEYFRKQVTYEGPQHGNANVLDCFTNIGVAYKLLDEYDSALHYFNNVYYSTSVGEIPKNKALRLIGDVYSLTGRYDLALKDYNQSIQKFLILKDTTELFHAFNNKGDCLLRQKRLAESSTCFEQAKGYINADVTGNQKSTLYHNMADVYSYTNNFKKAFYYKNIEGNIKDSFNIQNVQKASADRENSYKNKIIQDSLTISEKNKLIAINESKIATNESRDTKRKFIVTLVGAIVICLIAFLALRNATLRKKANKRLTAQKAKVEALADKLEEANQTKARLFSVISHDLRSPVSSLYASLKMQELRSENGETNKAVSSQIMHLLDTLEDLLTWSKSQMDRFTLQPATLRLSDLYADLIELNYDAAASKQITVVNKAEREVKICTDENLLKTILRNVLANSINHAPNKSTVEVAAVACAEGVICTISNEATATDAAMLEARLQTATIGSSKHGLGNVLIKEFTQKLNASFEITYRNGKVYLQITVPAMQKGSLTPASQM